MSFYRMYVGTLFEAITDLFTLTLSISSLRSLQKLLQLDIFTVVLASQILI